MVALTVDQTVVSSTPVDTGRARGNWQVSLGFPVVEEQDLVDKAGTVTIAAGAAVIRSRQSGQTIFISNNVPYIGRLNQGSSSQAPANFVEMAVMDGIRALNGQTITRG